MKNYTIEELQKKFDEHTNKAIESTKIYLKEFIEKNPGKEIPSYLTEDFYLSDALYSMCEYIKKNESYLSSLPSRSEECPKTS